MMLTPAILWVNAKINSPELSLSTFRKWYDEVHFPHIVKTSGMKTAYRYEALDPAAERPFFAWYPVKDITFLTSEEFYKIPVTNDLLPGPSHSIFNCANFDTRYYILTQTYEPEGTKAGPGNLIISAALTPATGTDDDFDAWYRQEHCEVVSKCTGYRRTTRFKLATDLQNNIPGSEKENLPPMYLALHEFDGETLPVEELMKTAETPWAKKVMGGLVQNEALVFKYIKGFGDVDIRF